MNVVLVCGDYRPERDGVAHYTARLAAELGRRGVDVAITSGGGGAAPGLPITRDWDLPGVLRAGRALRRLAADVVHLQFAPSAYAWHGTVGLLPAFLSPGTALVTTVHEYAWWAWAPPAMAAVLARAVWPRLERRGWWDRETGLLVPRSRAVIATNPGHAEAVRSRLPGTRVLEVPIGANVARAELDPRVARAGVRAELGLAPEAPLIAFFGFVHAVKGIRYLLDAVALLRTTRPDVALVLAGGTESLALRDLEAADYRAEVDGMIADRGLGGAVHLTGWQPEERISHLLAAADVAALPFTSGTTRKSGSLLACAEHGLPLVVTAATPPDPALIDGETALLVPTRDGPTLAAGLQRVLDDPALAAALAAGARRLAARHGWEAITEAHVRLYKEVAA